ncbi:family 43 glycosylhydrolase [Paenibacillus sp. TRM 82003]|nr:family 43 glycosylhydrolase [Paenibacillus sp. TRM 82003]
MTRVRWAGAVVAAALAVVVAGWMVMLNMENNEGEPARYVGHGGTFKNTLAELDTPDPSIVYKDGFYYMTFTHNGADVMVMKSRTLDFRQAERKVVWYPPIGEMYSTNLWAPEIQFVRGKWYIYFAADDGANENHRMYALEADTDDPMGSYTFRGQVTDETNKWAIDGLVLEHEERLYFIWSGWEGDINIQQNTYIAPMSDPVTISGPRVLLSEPDLEWERAGGPPYINEGQAILKKDGRVFLAYSGAGSWTPFYSIGVLKLKEGGDPLNPADWTKAKEPLMAMDDEAGVYGPGHNTFVTSPDGAEQWLVYHATSGINDGWANRKARAQRIEWAADGMPVLGSPLSLETAIPVPSGDGVFRAEHAEKTGDGFVFGSIPASNDTEAPLLIHYRNASGAKSSVALTANGAAAGTVELPPTLEGRVGYAYATVPLTSGMNAISLAGGADIAAIEIPRYEAENAQGSDGMEAVDNPFSSGWGVMKAGPEGAAAVAFENVRVPRGGTYVVRLALSNATAEDAELRVAVDGDKERTVTVAPGERNRYAMQEIELPLKEGVNAVTLKRTTGALSIDYMDIVLP